MMDEATRRQLLSSVDAFGKPKWEPAKLSDLAQAQADSFEGVRKLQATEWESPGALEWQETKDDWAIDPTVEKGNRAAGRSRTNVWVLAGAIFILALLPRIIFLYFVTDPDVLIPSWSNDTWHRWQIAYLSKEIGFRQDPARLWDLKGLEYFWGVIHPLISSALFAITGSVDVMILRWMTMIAGALNIVLLFLIGRRFWGRDVGWAAALIAILNPIIIFNDPSGMVEPLSFVFLLAGIYVFPKRPVLAGALWGLAAMTRAEAWLMSAGLLFAALLAREALHKKIALAVGWAIPVGLYMKHLLDITGNAIYPIYWNFLANAAGKWEFRQGFTPQQLAARPILGAIFVLAAIGAAWVLWRRPRGYLIYLLGAGTTAFISGFIGLTSYLKSYETWFWMTRFFIFSYLFLGLLIAVAAFRKLPSRSDGRVEIGLSWAAVAVVLVALQFTWPAVLHDLNPGYTSQTIGRQQEQQGREVARWYSGGKALIPEDAPQLTYAIARYGGIEGESIMGQMYGPDYYFEGGDPLEHWQELEPLMLDWLAREDVRLLLVNTYNPVYLKLVQENRDRFSFVAEIPYKAISVYLVDL